MAAEDKNKDAQQEPGSTEKKSFWSKLAGFRLKLGDAWDEPGERGYQVDVKKSIDEAQLLLEYVASQGKKIEEDIVSTVVSSSRIANDPEKWTGEAETKFWIIFNRLAKMVEPVTINSLKANSDRHGRIPLHARLFPGIFEKKRISEAQRVVRRKKLWTLVTLVFLIVVQIYWFVGNAIVKDLDLDKWIDVQNKMYEAENKLYNYQFQAYELGDGQAGTNKEQITNESKGNDARDEARKYEAQVQQLTGIMQNNIGLLNKWNDIWRKALFLPATDEASFNITTRTIEDLQVAQVPRTVVDKLHKLMDQPVRGTESFLELLKTTMAEDQLYNYGFLILKHAKTQTDIGDRASNPSDPRGNSKLSTTSLNDSIKSAKFALDAFAKYLLPLLYGLLGAFAYVLRTLTVDVKNLTYTPESNIRYGLRLQLGALAGLAIGWFIDPNTTGLNLSSWALAFLAGYSVEVLFAAMDKFIAAFSEDSREGQNNSAETRPA
jgi:hypothetical protein